MVILYCCSCHTRAAICSTLWPLWMSLFMKVCLNEWNVLVLSLSFITLVFIFFLKYSEKSLLLQLNSLTALPHCLASFFLLSINLNSPMLLSLEWIGTILAEFLVFKVLLLPVFTSTFVFKLKHTMLYFSTMSSVFNCICYMSNEK